MGVQQLTVNVTGTHRLRGQIGAAARRLKALAVSAKLLVCFLLQAPALIQLGTVSSAATAASRWKPFTLAVCVVLSVC